MRANLAPRYSLVCVDCRPVNAPDQVKKHFPNALSAFWYPNTVQFSRPFTRLSLDSFKMLSLG
jgi:hypothetical protein